MQVYKVAIIGSGGRGKCHARAYAVNPEAKIVACADIKKENAEALAAEQGLPKSQIYLDHKEMLRKEKPDIVSVCTWPESHAQMVVDSVETGVKAIFLEKPLAPTWAESKKLYQACVDGGVVLAVCHQRRFAPLFVKARELANNGTIGQLHRVEGFCPNLFDWGTHWFDMFNFYNNDQPAEWVIGQISYEWEKPYTFFGVPVETNGLSYIKWKNGVCGLMVTGRNTGGRCANRLIGSKGMIELDVFWNHQIWGEKKEGPILRVLSEDSKGWLTPELRYSSGELYPYKNSEQMEDVLAVKDLIECLKTGREPVLAGWKALQATELIFATYESSRRRARVYLPLDIEDSPYISMLESGVIGPKAKGP
ncbi:Gfo/Idh/MocA family oxidoreductase [Candidatus Bathyarchaeota archaeon]|nr:Gfo/Idh/MocA family oxidoreductase [Candidatus Bathyarchaeota archaeon]